MKEIYIKSAEKNQKSIQLREYMTAESTEVLDEITGDIDLVQSISDILSRNNLDIQEIEKFTVFPGPGSFTGLKMGVTVANILNFATGKIKSTEFELPQYGSEPNITTKG